MPKLHNVMALKQAFFRVLKVSVRLTEHERKGMQRAIGQVAGTVQAVFDNPNGHRDV